jgi:vacuolar-type H+-ATPase subunit C/Vma6
MSLLQVFRYAYGGAKVMALKGNLLNPGDYHFLLRARDLDDLLGYLHTTAYGPVLAGWDWRRTDAGAELSRRLYGDLALALVKVGRGLRRRESRFVELLGRRLVAENLKVVLRALHLHLPAEAAAAALLPVAGLTRLDFPELLAQGGIPRLVDYLSGTPWGPPLRRGLPRYQREENLFPLEMSLDLWVFDSFWQGLSTLAPADRGPSRALVGVLADITNITWAGRFRDLYGFPPEETFQYLVAAGHFHSPEARRALAFATNAAARIAALPSAKMADWLQGSADFSEVEARLQKLWFQTLKQVFDRPPFQMALPLAYLFFKELELDNLVTLITGLLLKVPMEQLAPKLVFAGGGHV